MKIKIYEVDDVFLVKNKDKICNKKAFFGGNSSKWSALLVCSFVFVR